MIPDEKTILAAYQDAGRKEVVLSKLERQKRVIDLKIAAARRDLTETKDKIYTLHHGLSEEVAPYEDHESLVISPMRV